MHLRQQKVGIHFFFNDNVISASAIWTISPGQHDCWSHRLFSSSEIILTVNLSETLNGSLPSQRPPTGRLPRTQTPCSGISPAPGGHFIKLSTLLFWGSEVTWPSPTMQTLWQGCSSRIKEVINQLTRLLRTILALHWGGKQCSHSRRWEEPSRAEPSWANRQCPLCSGWQHGTKTTAQHSHSCNRSRFFRWQVFI